MELKPRFTNRSVRRLFEAHQIDLMRLGDNAITDPDQRLKITQAGMPEFNPDDVAGAIDDLTPGEHIDILISAISRDLVPASIREATAKAASSPKSEG